MGMAREPEQAKAQSASEAARRERLAQALRDNLKRRKAQGRSRAAGEHDATVAKD